ncbi:MAG: O-methyltransferase [Armatimonadota bacterium]
MKPLLAPRPGDRPSEEDSQTYYEIDCPQQDEVADVELSLRELAACGILPDGAGYDAQAFARFRDAIKQHFEVPWTAIRPAMERLLFALSGARRPRTIIGLGTFCGNTLAWNVGPALSPWRAFEADRIIGVDTDAEACELARANFARLGVAEEVEILTADGHQVVRDFDDTIDLLYLDAHGPLPGTNQPATKMIYLSLLQEAEGKLRPGSLVVAHDTLPEWFVKQAGAYLDYVRDSRRFAASASVAIDDQGLEITKV